MHYDALIFDLDGTLWNSTAACAMGWNRALEKLKKSTAPVTPEQIGKIMGLPHDRIFERFFPDTAPEERERIGEACYREELIALRAKSAPLYPGVAEGLIALARQYPLYIVSNCLTEYLQTFLDGTGLRPLFKGHSCLGDTGRPKSENLAALIARHKLTRAAYIGDTAGDQSAAERAGVDYFHVGYGFGDPDRDCMVFTDFADLTRFFLEP